MKFDRGRESLDSRPLSFETYPKIDSRPPGDKHMNHPIDPPQLNRRDLLGAAGLAATGGALRLPALEHVQAAVGGQPAALEFEEKPR